MTSSPFWLGAARHIVTLTAQGLRNGVADVRQTRRNVAESHATPAEINVLISHSGLGEHDQKDLREKAGDPFHAAALMRRNQTSNQHAKTQAANWLAASESDLPGLRQLSQQGGRPLAEFHTWMTGQHSWTAPGFSPQDLWRQHRSLVEARWGEHLESIRISLDYGMG